MGSSPRTKADYLKAIERKTSMLATLQNNVLSMKKSGNKVGAANWQMEVNNCKAEIARLKLAMKSAPKEQMGIEDGMVKWVPYSCNEIINGRYPLDTWHKIVRDIDSDEEWADFLENTNFVKCYVLKLCSNDKSIAFVYTIQEDLKGDKVSIHGGGWESPLMYYRGYILMLKHLLEKGIKVRTYCDKSNRAAIRFDKSVGFVPYRYSAEEVFMWISEKRLKSSKLYKYFYH